VWLICHVFAALELVPCRNKASVNKGPEIDSVKSALEKTRAVTMKPRPSWTLSSTYTRIRAGLDVVIVPLRQAGYRVYCRLFRQCIGSSPI